MTAWFGYLKRPNFTRNCPKLWKLPQKHWR